MYFLEIENLGTCSQFGIMRINEVLEVTLNNREVYLVTGGAGFIGSNIVDELLRQGHEVRVLDNFSTGKRENLAHAVDHVTLFEGDVRSYERVHNAVKGVDYVIHEAALPSVPRSIQDPLTSNEVNVSGTLNVLSAARDEGVKRVVIASSSSVYGANSVLPKREDLQAMPISPYAVSKLAAEQYCMAYFHVFGLQTVALRYFNVFGPRQDPDSQYSAVIPKFLKTIREGERPIIFGDGSQTRDFTFIENVVNATIAATQAPALGGEVLNVACGASHSLLDLIEIISKTYDVEIAPVFAPARSGDVQHSFANIEKAGKVLGYEPSVSFDEGVRRTAGVATSRPEEPTKPPETVLA